MIQSSKQTKTLPDFPKAVYGCQDQGCDEFSHFPEDLRLIVNPPKGWDAGWYCEGCADEARFQNPDTQIGETLEHYLSTEGDMIQSSKEHLQGAIVKAAGVATGEALEAADRFPAFNSAHEAYGVLMEEVEEFWEEVKKKRKLRDYRRIRAELLQVAAVAIRAAVDLQPETDREALADLLQDADNLIHGPAKE